jgi:hypothetical protein
LSPIGLGFRHTSLSEAKLDGGGVEASPEVVRPARVKQILNLLFWPRIGLAKGETFWTANAGRGFLRAAPGVKS